MTKPIEARNTPWQTVLLLCGKCARIMDGGYGDSRKESLRTVLRAEIRAQGHARRVRIMETKCLGLCPKKAVTALNASAPGRIMTVPRGTRAQEALAQLIGRQD